MSSFGKITRLVKWKFSLPCYLILKVLETLKDFRKPQPGGGMG